MMMEACPFSAQFINNNNKNNNSHSNLFKFPFNPFRESVQVSVHHIHRLITIKGDKSTDQFVHACFSQPGGNLISLSLVQISYLGITIHPVHNHLKGMINFTFYLEDRFKMSTDFSSRYICVTWKFGEFFSGYWLLICHNKICVC